MLDIDGIALEQATNLSNLPFGIEHVALMPDAPRGNCNELNRPNA